MCITRTGLFLHWSTSPSLVRLLALRKQQALCGLPVGVSRLDHVSDTSCTMTENLHALSPHGPQFPWKLDLTVCSVVEVHSFPDRLGSPPLALLSQDLKCSFHKMDPILFLSWVLRVGSNSLSPFHFVKGLPAV